MTGFRVRMKLVVDATGPPDFDLASVAPSLVERLEKAGTCRAEAYLERSSGDLTVWVFVDAADLMAAVVEAAAQLRSAVADLTTADVQHWSSSEAWPAWLRTDAIDATPADPDEGASEAQREAPLVV